MTKGKVLHYFAYRVRRLSGLDQDVLDDLDLVLDFTTLVHPFLHPHAFEYWRKLFTIVAIPSSQRVGLCIFSMHA